MSRNKLNPVVFKFAAGALFLAGAFYVCQRAIFLLGSGSTVGSVVQIESYNDRCGGGRRRRSYSCTRFRAVIDFESVEGRHHALRIGAGRARGHDRDPREASYQEGQILPVVYSKADPNRSYLNTLWGVWGTPIELFAFQFIAMFAGAGGRRRDETDEVEYKNA